MELPVLPYDFNDAVIMDADFLNAALDLRLSEDVSVNERLQALYPYLSEEEADGYRRECGVAIQYGVEVAEKIWMKTLLPGQTGDGLLRERFPWLRPEKTARLLSYGMYSAARNYGDASITSPTNGESLVVWGLWFLVFVFFLFCLAWRL